MLTNIRQRYNAAFKAEIYEAFLKYIGEQHNHTPLFRVAETPIFIPNTLKNQLLEACDLIAKEIAKPDFKVRSQGALVPGEIVPNEDAQTTFLQMDFGVCQDENGKLSPQLIEIQGFPSLYFFQNMVANAYDKFFDLPEGFVHLFNGLTSEEYIELLRKVIIGDTKPERVIMLEVEPEKQVTQIDFLVAEHHLGMKTLCVSKVKTRGADLYYLNDEGLEVPIEKIMNRVIFDELLKRKDLKREFSFAKPANVKWIGHPNWFYRISKHTLPLLENQYVPKTYYLDKLESIPEDLHNYVLKPLYCFAGEGVIIHVNQAEIDAIKNPENYVLQRKVVYAPAIATPTGPAKCEIRMLMVWEEGAAFPKIINTLGRISKGEMVGVRYNKDKDWVGGSVGFFQQ